MTNRVTADPEIQKKFVHRVFPMVREVIAGLFWLYFVANTFLYDIDAATLRRIGVLDSHWFPWYKVLIVVVGCAILTRLLGAKAVAKQVAYVIGYPLILLWRIAKIVLKNPTCVIPFLPAMWYLAKHFRSRIYMTIGACVAATAILLSMTPVVTYSCMVMLIFYMLSTYYVQIKKTLTITRYVPSLGETIRTSFREGMNDTVQREYKALMELDPSSQEYAKKRTENIWSIVALNAVHSWSTEKLKRLFDRHIFDMSLILPVCTTLLITTLVFALCFKGAYSIEPQSLSGRPNALLYVLLSFNALFHNSLDAIQPTTNFSQMLFLLEEICGFFILFIFIFLLWSITREGYRKSGEQLAEMLKGDPQLYENRLMALYKLDPRQVLAEIQDEHKADSRLDIFIRSYWRHT